MTAISFNIAPHAATRGCSAPQGRDASASVAVAASHLELFKRVCRISLNDHVAGRRRRRDRRSEDRDLDPALQPLMKLR
jgi:hypothetical protein